MKEIIVWAEIRDRQLMPVSIELLRKANSLAETLNGYVSAVLIGCGCKPFAEKLIQYGATRVYVADDPRLLLYQSDLHAEILSKILLQETPELVMIGGTSIGMDLAPRVAAKLKTGLTAHCVDLFIENIDGKDELVQVVPGWGGNLMVKIICPDRRPQMVTVRPGVFDAAQPDLSRTGLTIDVVPEISDNDIRARTLEFIPDMGDSNSIDQAEIIVSGGFGAESAEGFSLIEALAAALRGEVAGTRPAYDQGWIPESRMIGQSGKSVKPELFISVAASGAIHYTTGFHKSKVIVAIDKNPKAPIFSMADLGIVGDFKQIVPAVIDALRKEG